MLLLLKYLLLLSNKKQRYLEVLCRECSGGLGDEIVASLLLGVALGKGHMGRLNKCSHFQGEVEHFENFALAFIYFS